MTVFLRDLCAGCVVACLLWFGDASAQAERLVRTDPGFPGLWAGATAWADYDGDGDLDVVLVGEMSGADGNLQPRAVLYVNYGGGIFQEAGAGDDQLQGVYHGDVAWADYDGDGDPDLALVGWDSGNVPTLRLYRNQVDDAGQRTLQLDRTQVDAAGQSVLAGVRYAALAWADYDGDGDLDLAVSGMERNGTSLTRLYANEGGVLHLDESNSEAVVNLHHGALAWGDYDNDGDLDLAVSGENVTPSGGLGAVTECYLNDPTGILSLDPSIAFGAKVTGGGMAWADYDADGNLDLAVSGRRSDWTPSIQLYRNRPSGVLTVDTRFRLSVSRRVDGALAWADYDNDGDTDLAATGRTAMAGNAAYVFTNDSGVLSGVSYESGLVGLSGGGAAWGDHDGDGDLDLLLSGLDTDGVRHTLLYDNQGTTHANQPPQPPAQLNAPRVTSNSVLFTWGSGSDAESADVTYNLRVGTEEGSHDIVSGVLAVGPGNAGFRTSRLLHLTLAPDVYYWNVQTVDGAFATSSWLPHDGVFNVQQFVSSEQRLRAVSEATMAWGDYDGDGDPDLFLAGLNRSGNAQSLLYENRGGTLRLDTDSRLEGIRNGDAAWGDYDNDGDLDLLLTGEDTFLNKRTLLYRAGPVGQDMGLTLVGQFPDLGWSAAQWGDYDGDGDLDLALMGLSDDVIDGVTQAYTWVFVNEGGFSRAPLALTGLYNGDLAWVDYDQDGDLDLSTVGKTSRGTPEFALYRNEGGTLSRVPLDVPGLDGSAMAWTDYDGDGDPDLALIGKGPEGQMALIYRNEGDGVFQRLQDADLTGVWGGSLVWGDYDNDQDSDLIITGSDSQGHPVLRVFENREGSFVEERLPLLRGLDLSAVTLADYDGDGDLDLFSAGRDSLMVPRALVNENLEAHFNSNRPPTPPSGGVAIDSADTVTLRWEQASDEFDATPASLTYNVRVGSTPQGNEVVSGASPLGAGNNGQRLFRRLSGLPSGTYYWSVQTVDDGFAASAWSSFASFVVDTVAPVVDDVSLSRKSLGLGQTLTMAVAFVDEHSGMDSSVEPHVALQAGDATYAFQSLQYTGSSWSGALVVRADMPSGPAGIVIEGAVDRKGNRMAPYIAPGVLLLDTQPPAVTDSDPEAGAGDVPVSKGAVKIRFSEALDPVTVTATNFRIRRSGIDMPLLTEPEYDADSLTVILRPAASLSPGTEYTVTVGASVEDLSGNSLGDAVSWSFRTWVPRLVETWPTGLAADSTWEIRAVFDGVLDTALVGTTTVHLYRQGAAVEPAAGSPRFDLGDRTLSFIPAQGLLPGSDYEVVIDGALAGPQRAQEEGDFSWRFQTRVPHLLSTTPPAGAEDVPGGEATLVATFDGPLDARDMGAADVSVTASGEAVPVGTPEYNPETRSVRIRMETPLRAGTAYEVRVAGSVGGPLRSGDYVWRFSTLVPELVSVIPDSGARGVPLSLDAAVARFSVPLDQDQVTAANFVLLEEGTAVSLRAEDPLALGQGRYALAPAAGWQVGSRYSVRISQSVRGPLGKDRPSLTWSFSTGSPDTISVSPRAGDQSVAVDVRQIRAVFDGPIDRTVLRSPGGVRVLQDGQPVELSAIEYDPETYAVRVEPAEGLRAGSRYQVNLAAGLGGALRQPEGPFVWSFRTAIPRVISVWPEPGQDGVPVGAPVIQIRFSQRVARQDADLFQVVGKALDDTSGSFHLVEISVPSARDSAGIQVVSFAPLEGLRSFTAYRVTVAPQVFGELATEGYMWMFSTASLLQDVGRGGVVRDATGAVELYFPPHALARSADEVRIRRLSEAAAEHLTLAEDLSRVTDVYSITMREAVLRKPVTLTLRYSNARLGERNPDRLSVFRWRDGDGWERVGGAAVPGEDAVQTAVDELGTFALLEDNRPVGGEVTLRDLDCQPRAFDPAGASARSETDISFELTGSAEVTVRVYDAAGQLVRVIVRGRSMAPGRVSLAWDGRNQDANAVPSGLYIVVVDAAGDHAQKVVAVIR